MGNRSLTIRLGSNIRSRFTALFYGIGFFFVVIRELPRFFRKNQVGYKVLTMQILFTGIEALGIISIISLVLGAGISILGFTFPIIKPFIYQIQVAVITRELGPFLLAFIIIARSGTAIATEIGTMVVNHEIEAYYAHGINPMSYIVVPRLLGVVFSMFLLTIYMNLFGLIGSYLLAIFITPIPFQDYMEGILKALSVKDLGFALLKSLVFGFIISIVASHQGFLVNRSSTEIPQASIKSVGKCFSLVMLSGLVLSALYYMV